MLALGLRLNTYDLELTTQYSILITQYSILYWNEILSSKISYHHQSFMCFS